MTTREPTAREIAREAIELYRQDVEADNRLREAAAQPTPQRPRLGLMDTLMYLVCFVLACVLLWALVLAPLAERMGLIAPPAQAATALPTATLPAPTRMPQYQAPPPVAPQEVAPLAAPATPAPVIVVTPTYTTGCHDGVSYVDGVPVNGTCAGAAFAPEQPTATIAPATAVPPDPVYLETIRNQAPHCIRCAP